MAFTKTNSFIKLGVIISFSLPFSSAFAGVTIPGTMTYSIAGATNVPTLSSVMLIVLSLLLFVVAVRVAKQKNSGINKMFITVLGVGSISLITGGVQLISKADAVAAISVSGLPLNLSDTMGSVDIILGENLFTNENGAVVTILSITEPGGTNVSCVGESMIPRKALNKLAAAAAPLSVETCALNLPIDNLDGCNLFCADFGASDES